MKKVILKSLGLAIAMTFGLGASAQCLNVNGDMETFTGPIVTSPNLASNAWINDDLDNWYSSHGTPTTSAAFPTTNMWMWSYGGIGEGVFTDYSFANGTTYEICYDLWRDGTSNPNSVFRVAMTTGLTPNYSSTYGTAPPIPTTSQSLATQTWTGTGTWVTITETITANANYGQLWLYPYLAGSPVPWQAAARIDNICVKAVPSDPCDFKPEFKPTREDCNMHFDNVTPVPAGFTILETYWDFGDGTTGTGLSVDHFYTATGVYKVCMTVWMINDKGECCKLEVCKEIEAEGCDPCDWLRYAKIVAIGTNPFQFSVSGLPSGLYTLLGYHWDFGDGNFGTGNPVIHTYASGGAYKVCVTLYYYDPKTKKCCSERVCIEVEAKDPKDVIDSKMMQGGGLEEGVNYENHNDGKLVTLNEVIISPNPSNGAFEIRLEDGTAVNTITVYDQAGKVVHNTANTQNTNRINADLKHLESGVYIIIINETDDMTRSFSKLIIE